MPSGAFILTNKLVRPYRLSAEVPFLQNECHPVKWHRLLLIYYRDCRTHAKFQAN